MTAGRPRHSWKRVAERLATILPQERLHPAVRAEVDARSRSRRPWVVSVSGGCDSVALALLVWAHWPRRRERLVIAHFDHRLRGEASAGDARFCRGLARGLGVKFVLGLWQHPVAHASEAATRAARMAFIDDVLHDARAEVVWTGHQRDDVAETMLMRMSRGSGTGGLAAPRPVQRHGRSGCRLRPLLGLTRADLLTAMATAGGVWREDESNHGLDYFRNRVRAQVIPEWVETAGRDATGGAALSRELLEEDDQALEQWLDELNPLAKDGSLQLVVLSGKPIAIWRRAVHRWLGTLPVRPNLSRRGFADLLTMARAGRTSRFSLGQQGFARVRRGRMFFEKSAT